MVRQFKTGGVYKCKLDIKDEAIGASFLIKVVGFDRTRLTRPWDRLQYRIFGNDTQAIELIGGTPSCVRTAAIEADEYGNDAEMVSMYFPEAKYDIYHIFISSSRVILTHDGSAPVLCDQARRPRSPCQGAHVRSGWNWLHRSTGGL